MKLNNYEDEVLEINNAHCELVKATKIYQLSEKLQCKHCNQLQRIMKWVFIFYRSHHYAINVPITEAQRNDLLQMYYNIENDINYSILNKNTLKGFHVDHMTKENGKQSSF